MLQEIHLQNDFEKIDRFLNNSFSAGLEVVFDFQESLYYGIGAFYQLKSTIDTTLGNLGTLPIYAFIDYPLFGNNSFPVLLSVQLGYSPLLLNNGLKMLMVVFFILLVLQLLFQKIFSLNFYMLIIMVKSNLEMKNLI